MQWYFCFKVGVLQRCQNVSDKGQRALDTLIPVRSLKLSKALVNTVLETEAKQSKFRRGKLDCTVSTSSFLKYNVFCCGANTPPTVARGTESLQEGRSKVHASLEVRVPCPVW